MHYNLATLVICANLKKKKKPNTKESRRTSTDLSSSQSDLLSPHRNVPHTTQAYFAPLAGQNGANGATSGGAASRPRWGAAGGDVCARCGKQVYMAEKKQAAGNVSFIQ